MNQCYPWLPAINNHDDEPLPATNNHDNEPLPAASNHSNQQSPATNNRDIHGLLVISGTKLVIGFIHLFSLIVNHSIHKNQPPTSRSTPHP